MDFKNYRKIVELQHLFNLNVFHDYLERDLNWNNAIIAESGELLDSLGYKWWKAQKSDMDNVKVEAIDLLHFVISETINIYSYITSDYIEDTIKEFEYFFNDERTNCLYKNETVQELINRLNYNTEKRFLILKLIFTQLEMTNEDVYIAYIVKNCLNQFRQNNGYKDGSYIKNWNGKEDNVVAYALANIIGAKENLFDELHESLNLYYNKEVLKVTKDSVVDTLDYFNCQVTH